MPLEWNVMSINKNKLKNFLNYLFSMSRDFRLEFIDTLRSFWFKNKSFDMTTDNWRRTNISSSLIYLWTLTTDHSLMCVSEWSVIIQKSFSKSVDKIISHDNSNNNNNSKILCIQFVLYVCFDNYY